jgi:TniQ
MRRPLVANAPTATRARLNLAPRLRADESLSSWLERFAGAYGLKLGEFMRWLGYRNLFSYGQALIDLDAAPPSDLAEIMQQHTGVAAQAIEDHRLVGAATMPVLLRRAFCPRCWMEEGPYRRREWASGWSLICTRHRSLLREKPPLPPPLPHDAEDSWLEYYETPHLWRETSASWESERWTAICEALGVNPRTEFARANHWLRDLQHVAQPVMPLAKAVHVRSRSTRRRGLRNAESCGSPDLTVTSKDGWCVKRDLVLYGLLKFHSPSLLETLNPNIPASRLIQSGYNAEICGIGVPEADYDIRLFAAMVAQHLWERMIQGHWRCRHHTKLEAVLGSRERWNDEDWWLERRLHSWRAELQKAGRELFRKQGRWAQMPPWSPCREHCTRHLPRGDRNGLVIRLPENWRCRWSGPDDTREWIAGRQRGQLPAQPR